MNLQMNSKFRRRAFAIAVAICVPAAAFADTFVCALVPVGNKFADFVPTSLEVTVQEGKGLASVRHTGSHMGDQDRIFATLQTNSQSRLSVVWRALQKSTFSGQMNATHKISLDKRKGEARFSVDMQFRGTAKGRGTCSLKR